MKKFFKTFWKVLLLIISVGAAVFVLVKIKRAILGKVDKNKVNFIPVPGDATKINLVKPDGSTEVVQLPMGVKYDDVKAAGVTEGNKVVVEILHEKIDRRDPSLSIDNNALDALRSRVRPAD